MSQTQQLQLDEVSDAGLANRIRDAGLRALNAPKQPSLHELIEEVHGDLGVSAHWHVVLVLQSMEIDQHVTESYWQYLDSFLRSDYFYLAMSGAETLRRGVEPNIDQFINESRHLMDGALPSRGLLDLSASVARRIECMTQRRLSERRPGSRKQGELA